MGDTNWGLGVGQGAGEEWTRKGAAWPRGRGTSGLPHGLKSAQTKAEVRGMLTKSSAPEA